MISSHVWKGGELPFMEVSSLWRKGQEHTLQGQVTGIQQNVQFALRYRVECDAAWCTRRAWLELDTMTDVRELSIVVNPARQWLMNGMHRPELDGLVDVDIQVSPCTNTLPIRRLQMSPGGTYAVIAAWIQIPSLDVKPIPQHYACVDEHHLHYRSGDFTAELKVDALGLVERYGKFWQRIDPH